MKACGANLKKGGECKGKGMENGRCRLHGGLTPKGMASPNFQTGRYSKYLPERLLQRYDEAQADAALIELRGEVSLMDVRLSELLERVDAGDAATWRTALGKAWDEYRRTEGTVDGVKARAAVEGLIERGSSDSLAWAEIAGLVEQRRKLVESETKRLKDLQQMITAEKAMTLIASLAGIVKAHVTDRDTLAAISADLIRLAGTDAR